MANIPPDQYEQYEQSQYNETNSAETQTATESPVVYQQEPGEQRYTSLLTGMSAVGTTFGNIVYESDVTQGQYYNPENPVPVEISASNTPTIVVRSHSAVSRASNEPTHIQLHMENLPSESEVQYFESENVEAIELQTETDNIVTDGSIPVASVSNTVEICTGNFSQQDVSGKLSPDSKLDSKGIKYGTLKQMVRVKAETAKGAETNLEQLAHVAIESQQIDRDKLLGHADVPLQTEYAELSGEQTSPKLALPTDSGTGQSPENSQKVTKKKTVDKSKPRYIRLPEITRTNLGDQDLLIEVDIDSDLFVSPLKKKDSGEERTKYFFTVSLKSPKTIGHSTDVDPNSSEPEVKRGRGRPKKKVPQEIVSVKIENESIDTKSKSDSKDIKSPKTRNSLKRKSGEEVKMPTKATKLKQKPDAEKVKDNAKEKKSKLLKETRITRKSKRVKIKNRRFIDSDSKEAGAQEEMIQLEKSEPEKSEPEDESEPEPEPEPELEPPEDTPDDLVDQGNEEDTSVTVPDIQIELDVNAEIQAEIDQIYATIKSETGDIGEEEMSDNQDSKSSKSSKRSKKGKDGDESTPKRKYVRRGVYSKDDSNYTVRKTETGKKLYECHLCQKTFTNCTYILEHLTLHSDDRPFPCDQCGIAFKTEQYLKKHKLRHEEKKVTCHICGAQFHLLLELKSHESIHSNQKQHRCEVCNKGFNHTTTLSRHRYVHVGHPRKHQCHQCGTTFNRKSNLDRHINDIHSSRKAKNMRPRRQRMAENVEQDLYSGVTNKSEQEQVLNFQLPQQQQQQPGVLQHMEVHKFPSSQEMAVTRPQEIHITLPDPRVIQEHPPAAGMADAHHSTVPSSRLYIFQKFPWNVNGTSMESGTAEYLGQSTAGK